MENFVAASRLGVRGLRNDYRWPGIGSALAGSLKLVQGEQEAAFTLIPAALTIAATAFLHLENVEAGFREGRLEGNLVLSTIQESLG